MLTLPSFIHKKILQLQFTNDENETFTISEMNQPELADGNCYHVSQTIKQSGLLEDAEIVTVEDKDGSEIQWHVAVAVPDPLTGEDIVYDYTASQFSSEFPFPYVSYYSVWADTIEAFILDSTPVLQ